jgi:uncharacterized protein (DUF58 family)
VHWKASARSGSLMVREFTREDDCRVLLVLDPRIPAAGSAKDAWAAKAKINERFERAVGLCASIAWHLFERGAQMQFRSAGVETPFAAAEEVIFPTLRYLAVAEPVVANESDDVIVELAASPDLFKVIVTAQPRGTIPMALWHSSYVVFLDDPA